MRYCVWGAVFLLVFAIVGGLSDRSTGASSDRALQEKSSLAAFLVPARGERDVMRSNYDLSNVVGAGEAIDVSDAASRRASEADARMARASLVMNIQLALKGAKCGSIEPNGIWDAQTKRAMDQFVRASNARLPISEPEESFLALIKSQQKAAGFDCRVAAVTTPAKGAGTDQKSQHKEAAAAVTYDVAEQPAEHEGRMSLGAPVRGGKKDR